jgi:hypothetical protein
VIIYSRRCIGAMDLLSQIKMPPVTYIDLVNYLICSKSPNIHEDLKAYEGLDPYKRFMCATRLLNGNLLMKAKVYLFITHITLTSCFIRFVIQLVINLNLNCSASKNSVSNLPANFT